jgi:hypothetical protein
MRVTPRLLSGDIINQKQAAIVGLSVVALPGYVCREEVRSGAMRREANLSLTPRLILAKSLWPRPAQAVFHREDGPSTLLTVWSAPLVMVPLGAPGHPGRCPSPLPRKCKY